LTTLSQRAVRSNEEGVEVLYLSLALLHLSLALLCLSLALPHLGYQGENSSNKAADGGLFQDCGPYWHHLLILILISILSLLGV